MGEEDQRRFKSYGHNRIEAAFVNRVFIVYKATGLSAPGRHKDPEILSLVKVVDFNDNARNDGVVTLEENNQNQQLQVGHVPHKLFNFPIYVSVPSRMELKWDARRLEDGRVWRTLSFAMLVKTKNRSNFYSIANTYL